MQSVACCGYSDSCGGFSPSGVPEDLLWPCLCCVSLLKCWSSIQVLNLKWTWGGRLKPREKSRDTNREDHKTMGHVWSAMEADGTDHEGSRLGGGNWHLKKFSANTGSAELATAKWKMTKNSPSNQKHQKVKDLRSWPSGNVMNLSEGSGSGRLAIWHLIRMITKWVFQRTSEAGGEQLAPAEPQLSTLQPKRGKKVTFALSSWIAACCSLSCRIASLSSSKETSESDGLLV